MSQLRAYIVRNRFCLKVRLVEPDMNVDGSDAPIRVRLNVRFDVLPAALRLLPSESSCIPSPDVSYSTRELASIRTLGENRAVNATGDNVIGALCEVVYCGSDRLASGFV